MKRNGMNQLPLSIHVDGTGRIEVHCDAANDCAWHWYMSSAAPSENGVSISNAVEHVLKRHPGVYVNP